MIPSPTIDDTIYPKYSTDKTLGFSKAISRGSGFGFDDLNGFIGGEHGGDGSDWTFETSRNNSMYSRDLGTHSDNGNGAAQFLAHLLEIVL